YRLKGYIELLEIEDLEEKNKKIKEDIEKLLKNREILIQYNNNRILNVIKGKWERYTFVDYYANLF
ncbi:MAG: hypothetical protein ACRC7S_17155, partial [Cetobacterium sp.]